MFAEHDGKSSIHKAMMMPFFFWRMMEERETILVKCQMVTDLGIWGDLLF